MHKSLLFFITVSVFGLSTTLVLALRSPTVLEGFALRRYIVGSLFALTCVSGMAAAIMPRRCSTSLHFEGKTKTPAIQSENGQKQTETKGHHPDCEAFAAHVTGLNTHVLCAACSGLFLGAVLALFGTVLYFFAGLGTGLAGFYLVLIGATSLVLGFFELKFKGVARLFLNTLFVLGAFSILAGIDHLASFSIDLFVLMLILFWLLTRVQLSQWDHSRICHECRFSCSRKEGWDAVNIYGVIRREPR
jgi:hypothetical protein